jgi:hypothetical protein
MHAKSRSSGVPNNNFNQLLNNAFAAMSNNSNSNEEPPPPPPKATKMNKINNMILERALLGNEAARTAVRRMGGARAEKLQASILNKLKENASQPTFRRGLAKVNVEVM